MASVFAAQGRGPARSGAVAENEGRRRPEPVRVRNRRRVLQAAQALIAQRGLRGLTMRELAIEAGVSVATVYNLVGGRDDVLWALSVEVLERFDDISFALDSDDPLDQALDLVAGVVDTVTAEVSPRLVQAVLDDETLANTVASEWRSRGLLGDAFRTMVERGELDGHLSSDALADQVWFSYTRFLRLWGAGLMNDGEFRARSLYALDVCLLAQSTDVVRDRILAHAHSLEAELFAHGSLPAGLPVRSTE